MAFDVRFEFSDEKGRVTTRTYHNDLATIALVTAQMAVLAPLFDAAIMGGLNKIVLTQVDTSDTFVALADSNVDKNATLQVTGGDGRGYPFNLPMIKSAHVLPGGAIDVAAVAITNIIDEFDVAKSWHINLNNPTDITSLDGGTLDT